MPALGARDRLGTDAVVSQQRRGQQTGDDDFARRRRHRPANGGLTAIGARPVQTTEPATKPEACAPPAAAVPEMTVPIRQDAAAKPRKCRRKRRKTSRKRLMLAARHCRVATRCEAGAAVAVTGARGQGFGGLSTGGGNGVGATLDVGELLLSRLHRADAEHKSWATGTASRKWPATSMVKITIQRDGRLTDVGCRTSERLSRARQQRAPRNRGDAAVNAAAERIPEPTLTVHLTFKYAR